MTDVVGVILIGMVLLTVPCSHVSGVEFLEKPQNVTLDSYSEWFRLNCTIDEATSNGMDWNVEIEGVKERACWSISSEIYNCTKPKYSVERPNNRTMNLIVHIWNSPGAGKYCCNPDNGQGTSVCSYVTVTDFSQFLHSDLTEASTPTTASANVTPSASLVTTPYGGLSAGEIAGIIVGGVFIISLCVVLLICTFRRGCPIHKCCNRNKGNDGNAEEHEVMATRSV